MSGKYHDYDDDDGRIIADMSDVERQPLLIPRPDSLKRGRRDFGDTSGDSDRAYGSAGSASRPQSSGNETVHLDADERRAMIGGAVSAGLLVVGVIAASFAALILLILKVWG